MKLTENVILTNTILNHFCDHYHLCEIAKTCADASAKDIHIYGGPEVENSPKMYSLLWQAKSAKLK